MIPHTLGWCIFYGYWLFSILFLIGGKAPITEILFAPLTFPIILGHVLRYLTDKK